MKIIISFIIIYLFIKYYIWIKEIFDTDILYDNNVKYYCHSVYLNWKQISRIKKLEIGNFDKDIFLYYRNEKDCFIIRLSFFNYIRMHLIKYFFNDKNTMELFDKALKS